MNEQWQLLPSHIQYVVGAGVLAVGITAIVVFVRLALAFASVVGNHPCL